MQKRQMIESIQEMDFAIKEMLQSLDFHRNSAYAWASVPADILKEAAPVLGKFYVDIHERIWDAQNDLKKICQHATLAIEALEKLP